MPYQVKDLVLSFEPNGHGFDVGLKVNGCDDLTTKEIGAVVEAKVDCGRTPAPGQESVDVTSLEELKRVLQEVIDKVPEEQQ
jgi:hypothetical protein